MRKSSFAKYVAPIAALPLLFGSCGEEGEPGNFTGETTAADVFALGELNIIRPGESDFSGMITDQAVVDQLVDDIRITEHQYPGTWEDDGAPIIGATPIRVDAHQAFYDESKGGLSNDVTCDVLRVNTDRLYESEVYIGVVALSDSSSDKVLISWPRSDEGVSEYITMCMDDTNEPSDGVILFVSDQAR